jgi:cytochrome P450
LYDDGEVVMGDVLVNLHGDDHRARRRLENRLFRRDVFAVFERELFPPITEATLAPYVADGRAELVHLGHSLMMNLAALTAGVDRPTKTPEETDRLYAYLMTFIEGATLAHYVGDKDVKRTEVAEALERFDAEFLGPSIERRRALVDSGVAEDELPKDVLTILLRNDDSLHLPRDVVRREIAFYLLAGAHTSATALVRCTNQILTWVDEHPEDEARTHDRLWVQRCIHETVRLEPSSPVAMRWALEDVTLRDGTVVPKGAKVVIDLMSVNRDVSVFGDDAAAFNPYRDVPDGVFPYGLSFGSGMHACIGQDLAAGVLAGPDDGEHLFGLVSGAVQALFDHGVRRDPTDPPTMSPTSKRPYWGRYPVVFTA